MKINSVKTIAVLWLGISCGMGKAQTSVEKINQLIPPLLAMDATEPETAIEEAKIANSPELGRLKALCLLHWRLILENFDTLVSEDEGKRVVWMGFEALGAVDYMSALEKLAEKFQQTKLSKKVLEAALKPTGRMRAFLADNYQHSRVQAVLNSLKPKLADEIGLTSHINGILSGKMKTDLDNFREAYKDTSTGDIPKVLIQP